MNPAFLSTFTILRALKGSERSELQDRLHATSATPSALSDVLLNPDMLRSTVQHLSEDALTTLQHWIVNRGQFRAAMAKNSRIRAGIEELIDRGWVFETRYGPYRSIYVIPWDMMVGLIPVLFNIPWDRLMTSGPERVISPVPVWDPFWHDVFQVLSYARVEPLLVTNQNTIYKRQLNRLMPLLWHSDTVSPDVRLSYILRVMNQMNLFTTVNDPYALGVNEAQALALFSLEPRQRYDYFAHHVYDPQRISWPHLFMSCLAFHLPEDGFLIIDKVHQYLTDLEVDGARYLHQFVASRDEMVDLGLWETDSSRFLRLSTAAYAAMHGQFESEERHQIVIQSTGEVMVPPQVSMTERWQLDALATRIKSDRVSTYQIDIQAVRRHIEGGGTLEQHLDQLQALSRTGVPDNVAVNLADWYRAIGRHRIMEVTLVHSERPEDSRDIETVLGRDALSRLSETDVVIPATRVKDILKRLERAGSPILSQVLTPSRPGREGGSSSRQPEETQWEVRLSHHQDTPPTAPTREFLYQSFMSAQRHGQPVMVTYESPGHSAPLSQMVIPIQLEEHWVQVYCIEERRYILIDWSSIMEVIP